MTKREKNNFNRIYAIKQRKYACVCGKWNPRSILTKIKGKMRIYKVLLEKLKELDPDAVTEDVKNNQFVKQLFSHQSNMQCGVN